MFNRMWICAGLAACGGGSAIEDAGARYEGIYSVTEYTLNEQACTEGGTSQLDTERFAFVSLNSFAGIDYVALNSCAGVDDCRTKLAELRSDGFTLSDFDFIADQVDGKDLIGAGVSTGFGGNATCTMAEVTASRWTLSLPDLRIEKRITIADDYPQDSEGFCTTELAKEAAKGNECSQFELVTATFLEKL